MNSFSEVGFIVELAGHLLDEIPVDTVETLKVWEDGWDEFLPFVERDHDEVVVGCFGVDFWVFGHDF